MMKPVFTLLVLSLSLSCLSQGNLIVEVTDIETLQGEIRIAVYNDEIGWDKDMKSHLGQNVYIAQIVQAKNKSITAEFTNLPNTPYAISLFHDINSNTKMDMGGFLNLIPQEPFGFSNNFVPKISAPKFQNCSFVISEKQNNFYRVSIQLIER